MIIKNFRLAGTQIIEGFSIANLVSEDGKDWYESQALFNTDKLKFEFDENGVITRFSYDVSMLWPVDKSVGEIGKKYVPEGLNENGEWVFDGKKIIPVPVDYVAQAESRKQILMNAATAAIAPLEDASVLGMATEEEVALLAKWQRYRVLLNRVDTSKALEIEWPEVPENVA
ncbi:tail fiber assembly protein [Enterobacter kobei]|uniref:tail fiber assembly protein n=1 Tax=Enterobacter kobei TaxID=208224 RepID=UPI002B1DECA1|nr:tail fiber assembly protein [Enterobacter kobei]MEA3824695.1 tail fiber assembly protein [Enterobacter kobei]MEA4242150.1 tail fiber assembly protein [Enterobacter kobei]